jgi:hypothetical protein
MKHIQRLRFKWFVGTMSMMLLVAYAKAETSIDDTAARQLADAVVADFIRERYKDLRERYEKPLKDSVRQDGMAPAYEAMFASFGKPLEVRFRRVVRGQERRLTGSRPFHKYWYDMRTTKAEMGKYFLWVDIVPEGDHLACSAMSYTLEVDGSK